MFKNKKAEKKKKEEEEKKKKEEEAQKQAEQNRSTTSIKSLVDNPSDIVLTEAERKYLLNVQRGDVATVESILNEFQHDQKKLDINCCDPLGRNGLSIAIENENLELLEVLLTKGIKPKDALLRAIDERYVEGVEVLLQHEEENHKKGTPYSWEQVTRDTAAYTKDITPLILAAHHNHYEILKLLLDRGATLPMPHDMRCGCDDCLVSTEEDSLRHSLSRINAYRALTSPSLIALSSKDPVLTTFELCGELDKLKSVEHEFKSEYNELQDQVMQFNSDLLNQTRVGSELATILNFKPTGDPWMPGEPPTLDRLKLAIEAGQKQFVSHPHVQQMLGAMWFEGLGNFKRQSMLEKLVMTLKLMCMFPILSMIYIVAPNSEKGQLCKKPFVKFLSHIASYLFFLTLLALASQNIEFLLIEWFGNEWFQEVLADWRVRSRGPLPGVVEFFIIMWVAGQVWAEVKALWTDGILAYLKDLWNIVDFGTNTFFMAWILLRATAWIIVHRDLYWYNIWPWYPKEEYHMFDPMLLADGCFGAAMIFSFLKLVAVFSVNEHLGPLQISLGRMIFDIMKFFVLYTLVLFAFGCGLNQMMWYYADYEMKICYADNPEVANWDDLENECLRWRRFINLFETSQSLFWAAFGLVELFNFDLHGIGEFTRFWSLLMFGCYSVVNVIVLLNLLIAMMSNSYMLISECSDMEWKFARTSLWLSYFEGGATVPPPFNMIPTPKGIMRCVGVKKRRFVGSMKDKSRKYADNQHNNVMRLLVRRYITEQQRKQDDKPVTEDDINEVKQSISSFRYELVNIMKNNGMNTTSAQVDEDTAKVGKKGRAMERRLMKGFNIGIVENMMADIVSGSKVGGQNFFGKLAKAMGGGGKTDWNKRASKRARRKSTDQIGTSQASLNRSQSQIKERIAFENEKFLKTLDPEKIVEYNPNLRSETPTTRIAYAKFKVQTLRKEKEKKSKAELPPPTIDIRAPTPEAPRSPTPEVPPSPEPPRSPTPQEERPMSPDGRPMSPEQRAMSPEQRAMSPEQRAMSPEQRAMSPELRPMSPEQRPMSPIRRSPSPKSRPRTPKGPTPEVPSELDKFKIKPKKEVKDVRVGKLPKTALDIKFNQDLVAQKPSGTTEKKTIKLIKLEPEEQEKPKPQRIAPPKIKLIKSDLEEEPKLRPRTPSPKRPVKMNLPDAFAGIPTDAQSKIPPKIKAPRKKLTEVSPFIQETKEPKRPPPKVPPPKLKKIKVDGPPILPNDPVYGRPK